MKVVLANQNIINLSYEALNIIYGKVYPYVSDFPNDSFTSCHLLHQSLQELDKIVLKNMGFLDKKQKKAIYCSKKYLGETTDPLTLNLNSAISHAWLDTNMRTNKKFIKAINKLKDKIAFESYNHKGYKPFRIVDVKEPYYKIMSDMEGIEYIIASATPFKKY